MSAQDPMTQTFRREWRYSSLSFPKPSPAAAPNPRGARSWMQSSTCSGADAPGGCWRTSSRRGRPSTTTSACGASTAPGEESTSPCAKGCAVVRAGSPRPAPRSSTAKPPGPPRGAAPRLRRRQEDRRSQAPPARGYRRTGGGSRRSRGKRGRPRWCEALAQEGREGCRGWSASGPTVATTER